MKEAEKTTKVSFEVRQLKRADKMGYYDCMSSVYGQTYPNKIAYRPDDYLDAVEAGKYYAVASFTESGDLAGHTSLWEWESIPGVFELGMCAVKEAYRHNSLQERMVTACVEEAKRDDKKTALYTEAICDHPYSQRTFYKCGLRPCGFTLNHYRPTVLVSSFSDPTAYTCLAMLSMPLTDECEKVYVPKELELALKEIYEGCGYNRELIVDDSESMAKDKSKLTYSELLNASNICFYEIGADSVEKFRAYQEEIRANGSDVVHLHFSMKEPGVSKLYDEAKKAGYFFCGIIPGTRTGDMLYMEKMVNCEVKFDEIVCSEETKPILDIIRKFAEAVV